MAEQIAIRNDLERPTHQWLRRLRGGAVLLVVAALLATSCAPEQAVTVEALTGAEPDLDRTVSLAAGPDRVSDENVPVPTVGREDITPVPTIGRVGITPVPTSPPHIEGSDLDRSTVATPAQEPPVYVSISIHVEAWRYENAWSYRQHRNALAELAVTANEYDAILSFEIATSFSRAADYYLDTTFFEDLYDLGHDVQVHADIGGSSEGLPLDGFTERLEAQRDLLESVTGRTPTHVSGICSKANWIEAAIAAGFTSTNGAVRYCMTSLDELPDGVDLEGCTSAADCHDPMPVTDDQRMYPFPVDSSSDFLSDAAAATNSDAIMLIVSEAGSPLNCLAETEYEKQCPAQSDDVVAAVALLDEYIAQAEPGRVPAFSLSWSIGALPADAFVHTLFDGLKQVVDTGDAEWASLPTIAERARP